MEIEKNKFVTISGSNNCGKTTLIRILNKEIESSHSIKIMDKLIEEFPFEQYAKIIQTTSKTFNTIIKKNLINFFICNPQNIYINILPLIISYVLYFTYL